MREGAKPTKRQRSIVKGQRVIVTLDGGNKWETTTRSDPWKLGGHTWVILLEGKAGGYALERVEPKATGEQLNMWGGK